MYRLEPHILSHKGLIGIWCVTVGSTDFFELLINWSLKVLLKFVNGIIEDTDYVKEHEEDEENLRLDRHQTLSSGTLFININSTISGSVRSDLCGIFHAPVYR